MITPVKYVRRSFEVEAVEVTTENLVEVSKWCGGRVRGKEDHGQHIKVKVQSPLNDRQTKAFPGDFVLKHPSGFKVYTPKAFENTFQPVGSFAAIAEIKHEPSMRIDTNIED